MKFTICLTYFKSLTLANLAAALYSVRRQDLSQVESLVIIDNDTSDSMKSIQAVVDSLEFSIPTQLFSYKHGDPTRTHAWSTNMAMRKAQTPFVLFTRADYLLSFDAVGQFTQAENNENQFIVGGYYDVTIDIGACEQLHWRMNGPESLAPYGREYDHVLIDSGVWMTSLELFEKVGGLDERLTAWGHAQTHFQHKLFVAGAKFVRIPHVLFYHPAHGYPFPKDIAVSHSQLREVTGLDIKECWARYAGPDNPYL